MDEALANRLAASLRSADPDRYFASLFAPASLRPLLFALYAFNHEVARIAETVREPMLGAIRLQWWREIAENAARGNARNHDVAKGLAAAFDSGRLALDDIESIVAARAFDGSAERFADFAGLEAYIDATGGALMRAAAAILGATTEAARPAALAYGLVGLLRSLSFHNNRHKLYLPLDLLAAIDMTPEQFFDLKDDLRIAAVTRQMVLRARDHFLAARKSPKAGTALPALLPAALVPVYLKRLGGTVPIHRRQMALLGAAMRGRL